MKYLLSLLLALIIAPVFAIEQIPEQYWGEWIEVITPSTNRSIGVMSSHKMMCYGQAQTFADIKYDADNQYLVLSFKESDVVWTIAHLQHNRFLVKIYKIENGKSVYQKAIVIDVEP